MERNRLRYFFPQMNDAISSRQWNIQRMLLLPLLRSLARSWKPLKKNEYIYIYFGPKLFPPAKCEKKCVVIAWTEKKKKNFIIKETVIQCDTFDENKKKITNAVQKKIIKNIYIEMISSVFFSIYVSVNFHTLSDPPPPFSNRNIQPF